MYHKACHIDLQAAMKSLKTITLYIQIHHLYDNWCQKLLRVAIFSSKSPKKYLTCSNVLKIPPYLWLNVFPRLKKPFQAEMARNKEASLPPTWNNGAVGVSVTYFSLIAGYFVRLKRLY